MISSECNTLLFRIWIVVIVLAIIVLAWLTQKEERKKSERSQKIDDLPILATRRSGISPMLSSNVNSPVVLGSA